MKKTTDNQKEIFDIVDEHDKPVGKATRSEVHGNPKLIHRSVGIAVFNSRGEIFLQLRSPTKDTDPSTWTISASGHVDAGKYYDETAHRELLEELQVDLKVRRVTKYLAKTPRETEMVTLYEAHCEGPFTLNPEEISEGRFFSKWELKKLVEEGKIKLSNVGKQSLEILGWI